MLFPYVRSGMRNAAFILFLSCIAFAEQRPERWIVVLEDAPLAKTPVVERERARSAIRAGQNVLRDAAARHGARVVGSVDTLANAIFVSATAAQAGQLRALPGVAGVVPDWPVRRHLNRALDLVNASGAWNRLGGPQNAGTGVKIAVLDTGVDITHPALQDSSLTAPAGFPKCSGADCARYVNSKVIVARSYVDALASGNGTPADSRPDDLSPRDRVGHGTALAAIAAGRSVQAPLGPVSGVAPRAFVGSYKIFGAPGVNDDTFVSVVIQALSDVVADGMDVAVLSLGLGAIWAPSDRGSTCNNSANKACDVWIDAISNATAQGLTLVVSAGNDGDLGASPNLNSINTPGTSPAVITVGATTNAHSLYSTAKVNDAPAGALSRIYMLTSDGPSLAAALSAPAVDIESTGNDGTACAALPTGSLTGAVALIRTGGACGAATKVNNAQNAGAVAVLLYRESGDSVYRIASIATTGIPSAVIGNAAGTALKSYLASHDGARITLDPTLVEVPDPSSADQVAYFSSQGPAIGNQAIKPELVAPGTGLYVPTQNYDPNGDMYDASGYTVVQGTSFASALVAGAAALAKQSAPQASSAQLKSMVVNTADGSNVTGFDSNGQPVRPARVTAVGAGKLNVASAVKTNVAAEPAVLSFGEVGTGALPSATLKLTNLGGSPLNLSLAVAQRDADSRAQVTVSPAAVTLPANGSASVTVRMSGSNPSPGNYEGAVTIQGGAVNLRVPYLYLAGDNNPVGIAQLRGFDWYEEVSAQREFDFKVVDRYGVPVRGLSYTWSPSSLIKQADTQTDSLGIGYATVYIGSTPGEQRYKVTAGNLTAYFDGRARLAPSVSQVVNAASFALGQGVVPGSYITISGTALSPATQSAATPYLPLSLSGASVSFDTASPRAGYPGRISYVSANQINVQVPWELQGQSTVKLKVNIGASQSALIDLPVASYSPAFFEFADPSGAGLVAAALDESNRVVYSANPVQRGKALQLYVNGLGAVDNQPGSGELSPAQPLAQTRVQPAVSIGGQAAQVLFSGLAPNLAGLYQVNVVVPQNAATGVQPLLLSIGGVQAKTSAVVVK